MNFGTGRKIYEKEEGVFLDSHLLPAAVKCWFTAQGKGMPLSMKIQDEEGNIRSIGPIFTDTFQKLQYGGISLWKYQCRVYQEGIEKSFCLYFYPEEGKWRAERLACPAAL
ncbi:MAG TPA: hypothetical protein H9935_02200 [Candidatus Blautia merdigallinarum]|uniref:Uncharacterized protein n=1 Tax=Candidatus Blautia merdigallinarum TaxID=2838495 RepID=A0A9D2N4I8_9FIRM|nr:hypothetical protein [Candidatus Blautia merdigallinarum]